MKYKLRNLAKCTTGLSQRRVYGSSFQQKCQTRVYNSEKKKEAHEFYLRDDVSRMTTGIKNTVTKAQVKKQRRILLDTVKDIYGKFVAEKDYRLSYSFFCKQRPFWVCPPLGQWIVSHAFVKLMKMSNLLLTGVVCTEIGCLK